MNIPEALGFTFTYQGRAKKGIDLMDKTLDWFAKSGTEAEKVAAVYLLEHTIESDKDGKFGGRIKKPVAAAKPATPPPPEAPPADKEPDEYQKFIAQDADDGFGPVGVKPLAMPKAVVPLTGEKQADVPEWAKELFQRLEIVGMKADMAADASTTVLERMTEIATTLKKWASSETPAPAAGVGQGGGGMLHIVKIKVTPKDGGKIAIDFYDDNPDHKYPEIRETRKSIRWANTIPSGWGIDLSEEQVYKVDWDVTYKLSDNKTEKGNPYKDVVSVAPRKK